tara:strand:- start:276 stop:743 length:468 start_codon:yes stop_codon:yes gene_type:complete
METKIIDNWLDKDLIEFLHPLFLFNSPHFFSQKSSDSDKNVFYISRLNLDDPLYIFLNYKLQKTLNIKCYCDDLYVNIQHPDMEGSYHTDHSDITCLLMVSDTLKDCGHFDLKDEKMINFVKNRLIIFDSKKLHRGLAPIKGVRISLAFKMILKK